MMEKISYYNEELPSLRFPWALKVSDIKELIFVSGHADVKMDNSRVHFPKDLIGQTKFVLKQISKSIEKAECTIDNAIRTELTVSKKVTDEQLPELFKLLADFVNEAKVKPAAGTMRFVDRLIGKDCLIEIEVLLAK